MGPIQRISYTFLHGPSCFRKTLRAGHMWVQIPSVPLWLPQRLLVVPDICLPLWRCRKLGWVQRHLEKEQLHFQHNLQQDMATCLSSDQQGVNARVMGKLLGIFLKSSMVPFLTSPSFLLLRVHRQPSWTIRSRPCIAWNIIPAHGLSYKREINFYTCHCGFGFSVTCSKILIQWSWVKI